MKRFLLSLFAVCCLLSTDAQAVCVYYTGNEYVCLSSDPALTTPADGARRYNSDTRKHYLKVSSVWQEVTDHNNLANKGTNTHGDIDTFISSKGQSNGLASLDVNGDIVETISDQNVLTQTSGGPSIITDLRQVIDYSWSAAVLFGGGITNNGDGTVSTAAGEAMLRTSASESADLVSLLFPAANNLSLTNNATNYVYVDYNGGTPQILVTTSSADFNCLDKCHLYTISREGTKLHVIDARNQNVDANRKARRRYYEIGVLAHGTGGTSLSSPSTRYLAVTSGVFWYAFARHPHDAYDTSVAGTANANVFDAYYRDGVGGWTKTVDQKSVNNTQYDDGDGTLGTLTASYYGVHWVYLIVGTTPRLAVVYGQGDYATLNDAKAAATLISIPPAITGNGVLIGRAIIQKDSATINDISSAFSTTFEAGGVPTHNSLAGIQGGTANEYYHLTSAQSSGLHARSHALDSGSDHSGRLALNQFTDDDATSGKCLLSGGAGGEPNYAVCPGGGGGDNITVNTVAATDADFDDATPAAPANSINIKWQKDALTPNNVSANVPYAAPLTVTTGNLTVVDASTTAKGAVELATDGESAAGLATQSNDGRLSNARTPTSHDDTYHSSSYSGVGGCTNQFARTLNDTAAPTCAGVGVADFTANQGTTTQVLHGNAAGQPSWGGIVGADLPNPGASTLGGVKSLICGGTDKLSAIGTDGLPVCSADQTSGGAPITAKLTSDYTNSTITGTNVSGLNVTLAAGTYRFSYYLVAKTAAVATGIDFGVNFTGTQTLLAIDHMYPDSGSSATAGSADGTVTGDGLELLMGRGSVLTTSTTAPNLNVITGVITANENFLNRIEGVIVVTVSGTLQLYASSDVAASLVTIVTGSNLLVTSF